MLVQDLAVIVKEGDKVSATVTGIQEFGCLVAINRAQTAILHISDLTHDPMLLKRPMDELLHIGQRFSVEVCDVNHNDDVVVDDDDDDVVVDYHDVVVVDDDDDDVVVVDDDVVVVDDDDGDDDVVVHDDDDVVVVVVDDD